MKVLQNLSQRERLLVSGSTVFLLVVGIWIYVWQPIAEATAVQSDRISRYLTLLEITRQAAAPSPVLAPAPVPDTSLAQRITQSGEAVGIPLARLDPDGARLRVTVAEAPFPELIAWIAELESRSGVRAVSVEMLRLTGPGMVSMRMMVENAS